MSDVGRYRKVYPRLWRHPGFHTLTRAGRELALVQPGTSVTKLTGNMGDTLVAFRVLEEGLW
jgi:hypothetical protein